MYEQKVQLLSKTTGKLGWLGMEYYCEGSSYSGVVQPPAGIATAWVLVRTHRVVNYTCHTDLYPKIHVIGQKGTPSIHAVFYRKASSE